MLWRRANLRQIVDGIGDLLPQFTSFGIAIVKQIGDPFQCVAFGLVAVPSYERMRHKENVGIDN